MNRGDSHRDAYNERVVISGIDIPFLDLLKLAVKLGIIWVVMGIAASLIFAVVF
jgi:hypothetical protein